MLQIIMSVVIFSTTVDAAVRELKTKDEFAKFLAQPSALHVVKFYAPWCPACRKMEAAFENVIKTFKNVDFAQVNTEDKEMKDIVETLGITALPTLIYTQRGTQDEAQLKKRIELFLPQEPVAKNTGLKKALKK